jgi:hypothetical protein
VSSYPLRLPKTGTRYFWLLVLVDKDDVDDDDDESNCKTPEPLAKKESFVSVLW